MNLKNICVLDFETDSPDPLTCEPTQLACVMINPRTLEFIPDSEFNITMRPSDIDNEDYFENHKKTIEFHARCQNKSVEEVFNEWKKATPQKNAWESFVKYLDKFHTSQSRRSMFTAPVIAGFNILEFDWKIVQRLSEKYGNCGKVDKRTTLFFSRDKLDVMAWCFAWFENMEDVTAYNMDDLRDYFGMSKDGAHDALKDVKDTGEILIKFLQLHRKVAKKVKFKGAFAKKGSLVEENNE